MQGLGICFLPLAEADGVRELLLYGDVTPHVEPSEADFYFCRGHGVACKGEHFRQPR